MGWPVTEHDLRVHALVPVPVPVAVVDQETLETVIERQWTGRDNLGNRGGAKGARHLGNGWDVGKGGVALTSGRLFHRRFP